MPYVFEHGGYEITLIDTPGFNDTLRDETAVLKNIASWLEQSYRQPPHKKLNGIIYMQMITDKRMTGSTLRNLRMFRELCGDNPLKNVILVTAGWGDARSTGKLNQATENEIQLKTDPIFWQPMIKRGSQVMKFEDTQQSAIDIIWKLVGQEPVLLQIQEELVDQNKDLVDTSAGSAVDAEIKKLEKKYREELEEVQRQLQEAAAKHDKELVEILTENQAQLERYKDDARRAQDELRYENRNIQREQDNRLEDMKRQLQRQKEEAELERKAQKIEDRLEFEQIVATLLANEDKVRSEERHFLEQTIANLQKQKETKGSGGLGKALLMSLTTGLGGIAMSLLGFPLLGNPFGF